MPRTSQSTLFIFQVIKLPLYQAAGKILINTEGRSKLSFFQGLSCLLQAIAKISTVYKFHVGRGAADRRWQF